jgi:hypothetical protein
MISSSRMPTTQYCTSTISVDDNLKEAAAAKARNQFLGHPVVLLLRLIGYDSGTVHDIAWLVAC